MKIFKTFLILCLFNLFSFAADFITIGTSGVEGTYYPTGSAVCKLVNIYRVRTKIRCSVQSTAGSVYNVKTVQQRELDFAIAQSNVIYNALSGSAEFKKKPFKKLKSIMAIYPELLTLITRKNSSINQLLDIKGKRINFLNTNKENESTTNTLMKEYRIKVSELKISDAFELNEMSDALKQNKLDGYFYMVDHPTANIKDVTNAVDVKIVPLKGIKINNLIKKYPYYTKAKIPGDMYLGNEEDIPTFGVKAVLFTHADVSEKKVYTIVKAVLENFDIFKKLHPAFSHITKESFLDGLSSPLHKGALKYYKEVGFL